MHIRLQKQAARLSQQQKISAPLHELIKKFGAAFGNIWMKIDEERSAFEACGAGEFM
jgi:hypothetical protein